MLNILNASLLETPTKDVISLPNMMLNLSFVMFSGLLIGVGDVVEGMSLFTTIDSNFPLSLYSFLLTMLLQSFSHFAYSIH